MLLREYESGIRPDCPTCAGPMHRIMLPSYQRAGNGFQPIVIHEGSDGTFSFPMHESAPVRDGFIKREIRTFAEADAVMRKVNAVESRKVDERICNEQAWLEHTESVNRSDLRMRMQSMSPAGRRFAEFVMAQNDRKARPKAFEPGCFIEVREQDASNREDHVDRMTNWRRRRA